jgi:hypothetical protein
METFPQKANAPAEADAFTEESVVAAAARVRRDLLLSSSWW